MLKVKKLGESRSEECGVILSSCPTTSPFFSPYIPIMVEYWMSMDGSQRRWLRLLPRKHLHKKCQCIRQCIMTSPHRKPINIPIHIPLHVTIQVIHKSPFHTHCSQRIIFTSFGASYSVLSIPPYVHDVPIFSGYGSELGQRLHEPHATRHFNLWFSGLVGKREHLVGGISMIFPWNLGFSCENFP